MRKEEFILEFFQQLTFGELVLFISIIGTTLFSVTKLFIAYKENNKLSPEELIQWFNETKDLFFSNITLIRTIGDVDREFGREAAREKIVEILHQFIRDTDKLTKKQKEIFMILNLSTITKIVEDELVRFNVLDKVEE